MIIHQCVLQVRQVRRVLNTYFRNVKQYAQILISRVTSKTFSTLMKLQKSSRLSRNAILLTDLLTQSIFYCKHKSNVYCKY